MFRALTDNLTCDLCETGRLYYDPSSTFDFYFVPETFSAAEISKIIDESINQYLVFKCSSCGITKKYTFKDIEKKARKNMYRQIINSIAIKELRNSGAIGFVNKTMIYCGKCEGFDGKGSCPIRIFDDCKLKRLPSEL